MLGETIDFSQFCELIFYDWEMFRDEPVKYLDDNTDFGWYLNLSIDVGTELTKNILTENILKRNG